MTAFVGKEEMGKRLVQLRGDRKPSVVARAINVTQQALSNYEAGIRIPRDDVKAAIANYYNTTVEAIFFV